MCLVVLYVKPGAGEENFMLEYLINHGFEQDRGYLKHNELHLLLQRGSRGLGSSFFQDVKEATGKEIFKQE